MIKPKCSLHISVSVGNRKALKCAFNTPKLVKYAILFRQNRHLMKMIEND